MRRAGPGLAGPGEVTARGTGRAGGSRRYTGCWGDGVPPPRSRRPGPSWVNAALPQANPASHPFPAQSVLLTLPQRRFPGPLGRADELLGCRRRVTALGLRKGAEGGPGTGVTSERGQGATPQSACAWAVRGLCLPRLRLHRLQPGFRRGKG